jgi:hypothetical protein
VYIEIGSVGRIWLRIGGYNRGEGRMAILTRKEARVLARALLRAAQRSRPDYPAGIA